MKKAFIITAIIMLIAGGAGWYYYDKEQKRQAAERAAHDSIRHARDLENARLAALDKARRDSLDEYEKTHGTAVIREALLKLLDDEVMTGKAAELVGRAEVIRRKLDRGYILCNSDIKYIMTNLK